MYYGYKISISIRFVAAGRSLVRFFDPHRPPATFLSGSIGVAPDRSDFLLGLSSYTSCGVPKGVGRMSMYLVAHKECIDFITSQDEFG